MSKRNRRLAVYRRDDGTCHYCQTETLFGNGTVDHVWPRAYRGVNATYNLVWCCLPCNQRLGTEPVKCGCNSCRMTIWAHLRLEPTEGRLYPGTPMARAFAIARLAVDA